MLDGETRDGIGSNQLSCVKQFSLQTVIIGHLDRPFNVELTMGTVELPLFQALVSSQCKS